jgi:4-amino-4-deoxy-L-arabinose transferase-like glycosyltransferase
MPASTMTAIPAPAPVARPRLILLLLAASVAAFLLLGLPQTSRPFHSDEVEFVRLGLALTEHGSHIVDRGFIDDVTQTAQFQSWNFHPPLYSWGLGLTYWIFGVSEVTTRGFGLACGVVSLLLVFLLARTACARHRERDLLAALAVLVCAVNPFFLQACLLVDIDGTVYPPLLLLLVYLALRLEDRGEHLRLPALAAVFGLSLAAKMTTALAFPVVLAGYHLLRGEWRKALGDALVVGAGGLAAFLAAYAGYAAIFGLKFAELFTHTGRSSSGFGLMQLAIRGLAFCLPLPLVWGLFAPPGPDARRIRQTAFALVACGLAALYALNLAAPGRAIWLSWFHSLTSFYLITLPFLTPAAGLLLYGAIVVRAPQWRARCFEGIDLIVGLTVAVLVAYTGVLTRGGSFSFYQAPVVPLLAVAAASALGAHLPGAGKSLGLAAAALAGLALLYGVAVLGDAYFLVKYRLFDVPNRELFGALVRWWAGWHVNDPSCLRTLANNLGYQPAGLGALWYALVLLPLALASGAAARWGRPAGLTPVAALGATAVGLALSLSFHQACADYRTALYYGRETASTRQMAAFINASVPLTGFYLAPRGLSYYVRHVGYIDDTRATGGYKGTTSAALDAHGALVFSVNRAITPADQLPDGPVHYAVGNYPLLDTAPSYRVVKQIGSLKLYQYVGSAAPAAPAP